MPTPKWSPGSNLYGVQNELEQLYFCHVPIILVIKIGCHPLAIGFWLDAGEAHQLVSTTLLNSFEVEHSNINSFWLYYITVSILGLKISGS